MGRGNSTGKVGQQKLKEKASRNQIKVVHSRMAMLDCRKATFIVSSSPTKIKVQSLKHSKGPRLKEIGIETETIRNIQMLNKILVRWYPKFDFISKTLPTATLNRINISKQKARCTIY